MGSSYNVDLRKGFARLNSSLGAWTRFKPGPTHPNVADFWRAFEKPSGSYCYKPRSGKCEIRFGDATVATSLFHYPSYRGLSNLNARHYEQMCAADIVVVESAHDDFALPPSTEVPLRGISLLGRACSPSEVEKAGADADSSRPACEAAALAAVQNKSWRLDPWAAYDARLQALLKQWKACRARRGPGWRPLFQLSAAPRATRSALDCEQGQRGVASQVHQRQAVNAMARRLVEAAGFEVFDPFAVTLHAPPTWFDRERTPLEYSTQDAEAVSDVHTQLLVNQLCAGEPAVVSKS